MTTELNRILGKGAAAVALSALIYSTSHLPVLQVEGFGTVYSLWFLQILVGASSLIACYWFSGRNLAAVILLHAYWDGIGAIVLFPNAGVFSPVLLILGQLSLPAAL
ncbi:MAG: CPBP family intramembrane metalloprotease [Nitrososphaerota archaeon]|nr:CPBP family intramembrane metalloprotease [Nitrososphaerota archaeon]MDG7024136.1 CPBP family intramembrane metalloprotease [Nitrososphaerota archaeon]